MPAFVALALFFLWATDQSGYPVTHWAPGGLLILGLLAITAVLLRERLAEMPLGTRVALGCLADFTALSYL